MKVERKGPVRIIRMIVYFIILSVIFNFIMKHLPDFIRSFKKPEQ